MKNRLSTLLMVFLSALMVTCSKCGTDPAKPSIGGKWNIVSVTSDLGASGVLPKYQAVGGIFEITAPSGAYSIKTTAGTATPGGTGTGVVDATASTLKLDGATTFAYEFTATGATLKGVVNDPLKTVKNNLTIVLKRL